MPNSIESATNVNVSVYMYIYHFSPSLSYRIALVVFASAHLHNSIGWCLAEWHQMKCSHRDVACEAAIHFYSFNFCASSYKIRALHATTGHKVVECRVCCHIFTAETEMYSYIWNGHSAANKLRDIYMTSSTFMLELRCDAAPHLPSIGLFFFSSYLATRNVAYISKVLRTCLHFTDARWTPKNTKCEPYIFIHKSLRAIYAYGCTRAL